MTADTNGRADPPRLLRRQLVAIASFALGITLMLTGSASLAAGWSLDILAFLRTDGGMGLGLTGNEAINLSAMGFAFVAAGWPWTGTEKRRHAPFVIWLTGCTILVTGAIRFAAWAALQLPPRDLVDAVTVVFLGPEFGTAANDFFALSLVDSIMLLAAPAGVGVAAMALGESEARS